MLEAIGAGFMSLMTVEAMVFMTVGVVYGLVVGILPGLGGIVAMALLLPFTYGYRWRRLASCSAPISPRSGDRRSRRSCSACRAPPRSVLQRAIFSPEERGNDYSGGVPLLLLRHRWTAGAAPTDIVTLTIFLNDGLQGDGFVSIRRSYCAGNFPASTLITVRGFARFAAPIEIQAVAVVDDS